MLNTNQLSRIDLNLLILFQIVLEEGHVGRAAGRLNLTPSAVSHGLGRLRTLLNDPLFLRTPKGVVPTERALALREPVMDILTRAQGVLNAAAPFERATSTRRFIIGGPDGALASTMEPFLAQIRAEAPLVDIGLIHVMPMRRNSPKDEPWADCLMRLEKRELDIALLPVGSLPPRFEVRKLYDEDFVVAMRQGHPFALDPTEMAFCAAQHLLVSLRGDPHGFVDALLESRGFKRRIALTAPNFMMALAHLANSDLIGALPRRLVQQYGGRMGLTFAELPFKRETDPIQAIATKAALMDAGVAWLMKMFTRLFATDRGDIG
jgi:DNA-binding transcriptional LysR family regulator